MTLDPEFNAVKIEKADIKVGYNPDNRSISIGTMNMAYIVVVQAPQNTAGSVSIIEARANEVALAVKGHFLVHPEQLKGLGSNTQLALVNATGTATYSNITFITMGTGSINI